MQGPVTQSLEATSLTVSGGNNSRQEVHHSSVLHTKSTALGSSMSLKRGNMVLKDNGARLLQTNDANSVHMSPLIKTGSVKIPTTHIHQPAKAQAMMTSHQLKNQIHLTQPSPQNLVNQQQSGPHNQFNNNYNKMQSNTNNNINNTGAGSSLQSHRADNKAKKLADPSQSLSLGIKTRKLQPNHELYQNQMQQIVKQIHLQQPKPLTNGVYNSTNNPTSCNGNSNSMNNTIEDEWDLINSNEKERQQLQLQRLKEKKQLEKTNNQPHEYTDQFYTYAAEQQEKRKTQAQVELEEFFNNRVCSSSEDDSDQEAGGVGNIEKDIEMLMRGQIEDDEDDDSDQLNALDKWKMAQRVGSAYQKQKSEIPSAAMTIPRNLTHGQQQQYTQQFQQDFKMRSNSIKGQGVDMSNYHQTMNNNQIQQIQQKQQAFNQYQPPSLTKLQTAKLEDYKILRTLGSGAFASVKLATHEGTAKRVALKIYSGKQYQTQTSLQARAVEQEIACMRLLNCEFTPKLYSDFVNQQDESTVLVMEYIPGQSLYQIMRNKYRKGVPLNIAISWMRMLVGAVKYMHSRQICHRDLKLENIIIHEQNNRPRIIDFGFSFQCPKDTLMKISCGTTAYMAPEIIKKSAYDGFAADIWALGVIFYVILTGQFPFKSKKNSEQDLKNRIIQGQFLPLTSVPFEAQRLISKMLNLDASKRPSSTEVLFDQFLSQSDQQVGLTYKQIK